MLPTKSPSLQQSSARGTNRGLAFSVPHVSDGWGKDGRRQLHAAPNSLALGHRLEAVAGAATENGLFCMARLSSGRFYFQRELISSGCAGVRGFFPLLPRAGKLH